MFDFTATLIWIVTTQLNLVHMSQTLLDNKLVQYEVFCFLDTVFFDFSACTRKGKFVSNGNRFLAFQFFCLPLATLMRFFVVDVQSNFLENNLTLKVILK